MLVPFREYLLIAPTKECPREHRYTIPGMCFRNDSNLQPLVSAEKLVRELRKSDGDIYVLKRVYIPKPGIAQNIVSSHNL